MQPFTIRAATSADLPVVNAIYYDNEIEADAPYAPPRRELACFAHELETGTMQVAERDGEVLGFASALRRGDVTYLSELFVRPDRQSSGIGRALLQRVLPAQGIRCTLASSDFRALGLYVRAGMQPRWPNVWLRARASEIGALPGGAVEVEPAQPHDPELAVWDTEIGARPRLEDMMYWLREGQAVPVWLRRQGQTLGYAFIQMRSGFSLWLPEASFIGPLGVRDGADAAACAAAAVRWVQPRTTDVRMAVPGPNGALTPLLEAGFRIVYVETFCTSAPVPFLDPHCYMPSGDVL
jgi:GNAT superfamily N-acetyltransferase